jgi:predicted nucleic acid-binding protein
MSAWLLDTNLLLRSVDEQAAHHAPALSALEVRGEIMHVANQSLFEFWAVASRPVERNGLGLTLTNVSHLLDEFLADYINHPDPADIVSEWRRLVFRYRIIGIKAHDMRLAAYARLHGIPRLMTFNTDDFKTVQTEIEVVSPIDFLSNPDSYQRP